MKITIGSLAALAGLVALCVGLAAGYLVGVRSLAADAAEVNGEAEA
jgi:hypothetical protein